MLDFPASPSVGQKYPVPAQPQIPQYTWDGEKWTTQGGSIVSASPGTALPLGSADPAVVGTSTNFAREDHRHPIDANSVNNILADNGGLEVWQRYPAGTAGFGASSIAYTADRWYLSTGAAEICSVGPVAGIANGSLTAANIKRNAGQTGTGPLTFGYPLTTEEIAQLRGNKCAISFVGKVGANWSAGSNLNFVLLIGTGAPTKAALGFTGASSPIGINVSPTTTATLYSAASSGVVPINATQAEIYFQWTPAGTAGADDSITIDDVQLEVGAVAHPFVRIPFRDMLEKCQAFYWKTFPYATAPAQNAGPTSSINSDYAYTTAAGIMSNVFFPRRMRVTPTVITYATDANNSNWSAGVSVIAAVGREWGLVVLGGPGTVAGTGYNIHATADASI